MIASISRHSESFAASPHYAHQIQLDGHLPEKRRKIIPFVFNLRELGRQYLARVLYANINRACF
jgi:hypothetical protein